VKRISLTKGKFALVDESDYVFLNQWKWHYNGHAERKEYRDGKQYHILMHRVIMNTPKGGLVDHINGDTLDNRRENLRPSNHSTNAMNMRKHKGASRYKGVTPSGKGWKVQIWKDGKPAFIASAPKEHWAALIYDLNAPLLFGEFARRACPEVCVSDRH
jgi:hypothetical protein